MKRATAWLDRKRLLSSARIISQAYLWTSLLFMLRSNTKWSQIDPSFPRRVAHTVTINRELEHRIR